MTQSNYKQDDIAASTFWRKISKLCYCLMHSHSNII